MIRNGLCAVEGFKSKLPDQCQVISHQPLAGNYSVVNLAIRYVHGLDFSPGGWPESGISVICHGTDDSMRGETLHGCTGGDDIARQ